MDARDSRHRRHQRRAREARVAAAADTIDKLLARVGAVNVTSGVSNAYIPSVDGAAKFRLRVELATKVAENAASAAANEALAADLALAAQAAEAAEARARALRQRMRQDVERATEDFYTMFADLSADVHTARRYYPGRRGVSAMALCMWRIQGVNADSALWRPIIHRLTRQEHIRDAAVVDTLRGA